MQPVAALNEYTLPLGLPTKTRPPAYVGCPLAVNSPGNPKAHFSFRRGICAAVIPAIAASWKRVLAVLTPQPVQTGPARGFLKSFPPGAHIDWGEGSVDNEIPNDLPVRNSAMNRR